jgi:hypothetical protein
MRRRTASARGCHHVRQSGHVGGQQVVHRQRITRTHSRVGTCASIAHASIPSVSGAELDDVAALRTDGSCATLQSSSALMRRRWM